MEVIPCLKPCANAFHRKGRRFFNLQIFIQIFFSGMLLCIIQIGAVLRETMPVVKQAYKDSHIKSPYPQHKKDKNFIYLFFNMLAPSFCIASE